MNFDRFHEALDTLIALNADNRKHHAPSRETLSPRAWAEDLCTVSCDIGRMTGKTEYIKRRAKAGDLVVTLNLGITGAMFRDVKCDVFTARQLERGVGGRKFNTIFVDDPAFVFGVIERSKFFDLLAHGGEQTFVMLGANRHCDRGGLK